MTYKKQIVIALALLLLAAPNAQAAGGGAYPDSNLPEEGQKALQRAVSAMKAKNYSKAQEAVQSAAASATDAQGCLFIIQTLSSFGGMANKMKRPAVERAMSLATTNDEIMAVAKHAREAEMYDLAKHTTDKLVTSTNSFTDLMAVAHQAHAAANADSVHLALQKAYSTISNEPDALDFIRQAHDLGIDHLSQKAAKDLIEDQTTAVELVALANKLETIALPHLVREALVAALDKAKTVSDYVAIFEAAKHFEYADIVKLATYRGRKLTIINKIKNQAENTPEALADQRRKTKDEVNRATLAKPSGF